MRYAAHAAIINDEYQVLLLRKKETWIFPGGKKEGNETDLEALLREITTEELPETRLHINEFYKKFDGVGPNTGLPITTNVYLARIEGEIKTSSEIKEAKWMSYTDVKNSPLAPMTLDIYNSLKKDGHLK
jgi:ADP-ribose pyrophosphatase YjhB (NUDIX family)